MKKRYKKRAKKTYRRRRRVIRKRRNTFGLRAMTGRLHFEKF